MLLLMVPVSGAPVSGAPISATMATSGFVSAEASTPSARVSGSAVAAVAPALAPDVPSGFRDSVVGTVELPTGLAWTPDGRMLVTSKAGKLVIVGEGEEANEVALNLESRVCSEKELGLVGIAVDPEFETNHFVYLYYTMRRGDLCGEEGGRMPVNRVGRFVLGDDGRIDAASEMVIVDNIVSAGAHHVGGDLEFGKDGYLYISVGDGICTVTGTKRCGPLNTNSQNRAVPHGKILRVGRGAVHQSHPRVPA